MDRGEMHQFGLTSIERQLAHGHENRTSKIRNWLEALGPRPWTRARPDEQEKRQHTSRDTNSEFATTQSRMEAKKMGYLDLFSFRVFTTVVFDRLVRVATVVDV